MSTLKRFLFHLFILLNAPLNSLSCLISGAGLSQDRPVEWCPFPGLFNSFHHIANHFILRFRHIAPAFLVILSVALPRNLTFISGDL